MKSWIIYKYKMLKTQKKFLLRFQRAIHKRCQLETQPLSGYNAGQALQEFHINIKDNEKVLEYFLQ